MCAIKAVLQLYEAIEPLPVETERFERTIDIKSNKEIMVNLIKERLLTRFEVDWLTEAGAQYEE